MSPTKAQLVEEIAFLQGIIKGLRDVIDGKVMPLDYVEPEEQWCDGCDGTGLMEGWNHRDGYSCPKCKGKAVISNPS